MTDNSPASPAFLTDGPAALHLLRRHAAERPDRAAVTYVQDHDAPDGARTLGYAALDAEARRVASWLQERCAPGDRVVLLHPPGLAFVTAFLGCLYAGVVAVPSPMPGQFQYQQRRVTGIAADARARVALTDSGQLEEARPWIESCGLGLELAASDADGFGDPARWRDPEVGGESLVLLQYTSGSTGDPKRRHGLPREPAAQRGRPPAGRFGRRRGQPRRSAGCRSTTTWG